MIFHIMLASKAPEFAITEQEAQQEAVAICNYLRHTKIKMDPKTRDTWTMIVCLLSVEGTRLIAFINRLAAERLAKRKAGQTGIVPQDGNVFPFGAQPVA